MHKLWNRLQRDEGFTLIELLVVIVIIGILLAIAVPSYLGFRNRAMDSAAQSNIRAAVPSAEAYFADNGNYTNMALTGVGSLQAKYDSGLKVENAAADNHGVRLPAHGAATYCLEATGASGNDFYFAGPGGEVAPKDATHHC